MGQVNGGSWSPPPRTRRREPYGEALARRGRARRALRVVTPTRRSRGGPELPTGPPGLVLCGGVDVAPERYGEEPLPNASVEVLPGAGRHGVGAPRRARGMAPSRSGGSAAASRCSTSISAARSGRICRASAAARSTHSINEPKDLARPHGPGDGARGAPGRAAGPRDGLRQQPSSPGHQAAWRRARRRGRVARTASSRRRLALDGRRTAGGCAASSGTRRTSSPWPSSAPCGRTSRGRPGSSDHDSPASSARAGRRHVGHSTGRR